MHDSPPLTRRQFFASTAAVAGAATAHAAVPPAPPPLAPEPPLPPGVFRRLGSARFRDKEAFYSLRFTTDGRWLVNEGCAQMSCIWDIRTGARLPASERAESRAVIPSHLHRSNDGTKQLVERKDGFDVTDAASGKALSAVTPPASDSVVPNTARPYSVSNDGRWVVCEYWVANKSYTGLEGRVLWDTALGQPRHDLGFIDITTHAPESSHRFSDDGRTLFAIMSRNDDAPYLVAFDTTTGRIRRQYPAALGDSCALSPDERTAVVYSEHALRVIDLEAGRVLPQSQDPVGAPLRVRHGASGRVLVELTDDLGAVKYGQDRQSWAVWDRTDGPVRLVPYLTHFPPERRKPSKKPGMIFLGEPVFSLSPTTKQYAAVGDRRVLIRDTGTHLIRHVLLFPLPEPVEGPFGKGAFVRWRVSHGHAWTPDGRFFVLAAHELFTVLDTTTGRRRTVGLPNDLGFESLSVSADGRTAGGVHTWDDPNAGGQQAELATAELRVGHFTRVPLPLYAGRSTEYWPSADFRRVLCQFSDIDFFNEEAPFTCTTHVFDVRARRAVQEWDSSDIAHHAVFTPDGRTVILANMRRLGKDKGVEHALEAREVRTGERRWRAVLASECLSLDVPADGRELLTAHPDAPVYLWDVFGEKSDPQPFPGPKRLRTAWEELAGNGEAAFRAVRLLVQHPAAAVELLGEKLKPLARPTDTWVRGRVQELGDREYAVRAAAERQLVAVAEVIAGKLDEFREEVTTLEAAERFARVLAAAKHPPEAVRSCRAVEVLEHCRTSAAGKLLRSLAAGPDGLTLTREAKEAVGRLG